MENDSQKNALDLGQYLASCPSISDKSQYWFFRTDGGYLFEPFLNSHSIAIGYPYVKLMTLLDLDLEKKSSKLLSKQIRTNDPTEERPGLAARQLLTFTHVMKEGDYVIIPSTGSHELAIGRITNKPIFEAPLESNGVEIVGYAKRRSVKWLKRITRKSVNPNLFQILYAHQTITNITQCAQWVDAILCNFFRKGDDYHYVLEVGQAKGINAKELFHAYVDLFDLVDRFTNEHGISGSEERIETRINLNSPGDIELITKAAEYIFTAAAIIIALNGGGLKFKVQKLGIDLNIQTDGLIKKINVFLNDKKNRQLSDSVRAKLEALKIDSPNDVLNLIDRMNKK